MKALKIAATAAMSAVIAVIILVAWWWSFDRIQTGQVHFSTNSYCELQVYKLYTGKGTVSYFENGVRTGKVVLSNDLCFDPLGIFPCPDGHSVVCVSWPDTFEAAFTINFSKRYEKGFPVPDRLKGWVVDSSDFQVRACTSEEVEFVKNFIRHSDLKSFAACTRWEAAGENEGSRKSMLDFLAMATSPRDYGNPLLKDAAPLILPDSQGR